jgi:1-aminocyclopropane-1-carboxylate deaminase
MDKIDLSKITLDKLSLPLLIEKNVEVFVLRLDKIHPVISGNKWFKLQFYLEEAKAQKKTRIVTMGGAWSNHILATAAVCRLMNLASVGVIRGEEPQVHSSTLSQAKAWGMQLIFLNRAEYREKKIPLELNSDENYFIDEGGYGEKGMQGAATILAYCKNAVTHICCAAGTGTMLAGLAQAASSQQIVLGFSVLKNNKSLKRSVSSLLNKGKYNYQINHDYHFGGYAKSRPELLKFMNEFYQQTTIPTDFVYTGKLFFAVMDLVGNNHFKPHSQILVIHSGGLQGNDSLSKGVLIF